MSRHAWSTLTMEYAPWTEEEMLADTDTIIMALRSSFRFRCSICKKTIIQSSLTKAPLCWHAHLVRGTNGGSD